MSGKIWVYSDAHFYHSNIVKFTVDDKGTKLRPWDTVEDMNEDMIAWYNELVDDGDRVYMLGDMAFSPQLMVRSISRLKGRKVLIPGNHDPKGMKKYIHLFDDVRGYVQRQGFIMSHIPIHPGSMGRWKVNIHGHLHSNYVTKDYVNGYDTPKDETYDPLNETVADNRYYCACVEHTNFRPKLLDDILTEVGLKP